MNKGVFLSEYIYINITPSICNCFTCYPLYFLQLSYCFSARLGSSNIMGKIKIGAIKMKIMESLSQLLHLITSHLPSRLPASPPNIDDLESQSSQPLPSFSSTISESQSPQARHPTSPESPPRGRLPLTINESQRNNVLDAKPDLETELRKTLLSLCFTAAIQITIQYVQVAESEAHYPIILISLAVVAIFASLIFLFEV
ncbi:PREDICTED: uncharacterized protein LOC105116291 [Populus euphratica]|uniref:Uncharacterized protein LOC105116291 n=1 Tax=Populus euphratica TaxID=75702 RepID=A0AAJ6TJB3_POPEU|nr:PREDICTED: uncharacterized protein LOC105116291 [Populus euphratica]